MAEQMLQQLKELGSKLEMPPVSTEAVVELLEQGASILSQLEQSPSKFAVAAMKPLMNAIAQPALLKHQCQEVKLLVASSACEIIRITAPDAPYEDAVLKDMFHLIVSTLSGLSDIKGPSFQRRALVLETLETYRLCVLILDLECDHLIHEMISTFFAVVSDEHPETILASMEKNMEIVLEESEDAPENQLLILWSILCHCNEGVRIPERRLAMNVINTCVAKLEPVIKQLLVSLMSGDCQLLKSDINHHRLLYDICRFAPQISSGVTIYLTGELLSDQLDTRLKAVSVVGGLFALPGSTISESFKPVLSKFLEKLNDRAVEVRMSVLEHAKNCLLENPFRAEVQEIISALCDRLTDKDENVRKQGVSVLCDVACHTLACIPVDTIKLVSRLLQDESLIVKRYTMERLADVHRASCMKQFDGIMKAGKYDWIIGTILRCFYDTDFRSDTVEPILSLSLFPENFSAKDRVTSWSRVFSGFVKVEIKALEKILQQKQRLQLEMKTYLSLGELSQECDETEHKKKVMPWFSVMSHHFSHPETAEKNLQTLDQLKHSNFWQILMRLNDPNTSSLQAIAMQDEMLTILGQKHQLQEFLKILSVKCSYSLFDKDHVRELLLEVAAQKSLGNTEAILSCMTILVILAQFCPLLFGGMERDLANLLEDDNQIVMEGTLQILAKAGGAVLENSGVSSRSLELALERMCIEGSRRQAKYAVYALASITKDDGLTSLCVLYKRLATLLEERSHLSAVLQSLGCIAEVAMPVLETRESEVEEFIKGKILKLRYIAGKKVNSWDDRSAVCSLKIFGIKALVKSYLAVKDLSRIDGMIGILKNFLLFGDISRETELSLVDRAHLKLVAAKAVLRLSRQWEKSIPVDVLYLALQTSLDNLPEVRKLLFNKVHQYIRDRILDPKYASAFLLDLSSSQSDFEEYTFYLNDVIQMCRCQGRGRQVSLQTESVLPPLYPEYILPHVVHSLAHHPSFPDIDECRDVRAFQPMYRQLYLFLSMVIHGDADGKSDATLNKDMESISLLTSIFRHIKFSEDAIDSSKSKNSYALCDLGMPIIKLLAPSCNHHQDSSATVTLPSMLYKRLEKKGEDDLLVGEEKTWLADEGILVHLEPLELDVNRFVQSSILEDEITMDSDMESSEMPLAKLMKYLKAKETKIKEKAWAELENQTDFGIIMKETKTNDQYHVYMRRNRSDHNLQKSNKVIGDVHIPKRRRKSRAENTSSEVSPNSSKRPTSANEKNVNADSGRSNEEDQSSSPEYQNVQQEADKVLEAQTDYSCIRKRKRSSSSSKQEAKHKSHRMAPKNSSEMKEQKEASNTDNTHSMDSSKLDPVEKQEPKTVTELGKDDEGHADELVGYRIKVWWPEDQEYYEGIVESYDAKKKKHVILYDDGETETLSLEKECWKLLDEDPEAKGSSSSEDSPSEEESPSPKKKKLTPQRSLKRAPKDVSKRKPSRKNKGNPDTSSTDPPSDSLYDESDTNSEHEESKSIDMSEELSNRDHEQEEEAMKVLSDAEKAEDNDKMDSQDSDYLRSSSHDAHGSHEEEISSSEEQKPSETEEESSQETSKKGRKRGKKTSARKESMRKQ